MAELQLDDVVVTRRTVLSRISCNSLSVDKTNNKTTPLIEIKPLLIQISLWKQEAGQPITPSEGIALAISLIDGKPLQTELMKFQSSIKAALTGTVSTKFWQNFVKRNKELIEVGKGYRVANNRTELVAYENIDQMYDLVYEQMVTSGVAKHLAPEEYYYVNEKGERVISVEESVGLQVRIEITHPEYIIFGDKVGTDITQKNDGHVSGQKLFRQKGRGQILKAAIKTEECQLLDLQLRAVTLLWPSSSFLVKNSPLNREWGMIYAFHLMSRYQLPKTLALEKHFLEVLAVISEVNLSPLSLHPAVRAP